jgi:outer membrane protein assembly factor BamB
MYCLDARTGRLVWRASVQDRLGTLGRFYATPAVAYGRVYAGATDGKVYSYGAGTGDLLWSRSTGSYVYGSPAIWNRRVYVGSYDKTFYALDAATGEVVWRFAANGPISGSATVIDGLVYFSSLRGRTYALDAATGHLKWMFRDGAYAGVVDDPKRLYLVGVGRLYTLVKRQHR